MSEVKDIPKHWEIKKLGEFIVKGGGNVDPFKYLHEDFDLYSIPAYDIGEPEVKKGSEIGSTKKIVQENDVLLSRIVPHIQRSWLVAKGGKRRKIGSSEWIIFRGKYFVPIYMRYYLLSYDFHQKMMTTISGVGGSLTRANPNQIALFEIPIPPLPEQQAIVAKIEELLSELDNGKQQLLTAQKQLKVYRQSLLKWAFDGKLTNKNVKDGELPKGWKKVELKNVVEKISDGPFGSNLKSIDYVDKGVRVIRLENIGEMEFRDEYKTFITPEKYETIKRHTVGKGDIIFSSFISDSIRSVVLPDFIEKAINKADCFLVRADETKMRKKYLAYYFSTKAMQNQLVNQIHGATRPRINTTQLKASLIPFAPINEQDEIVSELESKLTVCDKIDETISQSLLQAETLRQSILKQAFEGRLVNHN